MGHQEQVAVYPADNPAFAISVAGAKMNAVFYLPSSGPLNPTVVLLHGFPGYEQNLDLAQSARGAGWNVLTFHYRGTWGSEGSFSFSGALEDIIAAIAYLRANAAKLRVDTENMVIVGHSMGGIMGALTAADDPAIKGLFLLDAWDISSDVLAMHDHDVAEGWRRKFISGIPGLTNTDGAALFDELRSSGCRYSLGAALETYGARPIDLIGAQRGRGADSMTALEFLLLGSNPLATGDIWPTDHSFNDMRSELAARLLKWLARRRYSGNGHSERPDAETEL